MSAETQVGYSPTSPVRKEWKSFTARVQNRAAKVITLWARQAIDRYARRNKRMLLSLLSGFWFSIIMSEQGYSKARQIASDQGGGLCTGQKQLYVLNSEK